MDTDEDPQSYFSASNPPRKSGLGATLDELKLLQQHLMANRNNAGSPSRGALLRQPNVFIPSTGAANYWYVDPKAKGFNPMAAYHDEQGHDSFNPMTYAPPMPLGEHGISAARDTEIINGKLRELYGNPGRNLNARQAADLSRPSAYSKNIPGIVASPTMDLEGGAEGTGIFEVDNKFYILPTQMNGQRLDGDDAVNRFRETGEHLGAFSAEDDATIFEKDYLGDVGGKEGQKQFQLLPANTPKILMRTKNLPRFAGERDDLLRDIDNSIYGGGNAPLPTPKPTPTPQTKYFPVSYFT